MSEISGDEKKCTSSSLNLHNVTTKIDITFEAIPSAVAKQRARLMIGRFCTAKRSLKSEAPSFRLKPWRLAFLMADAGAVNRYTALLTAVNTGNNKVVQLLLQNGADGGFVHGERETALFSAVRTENDKVVQLLLEYGADVHAVNANGWDTALFSAVRTGNDKVVQLLLEYGADVRAVNANWDTALFSAVRTGNDKVVQLLLQNGAEVGAVNNNGETALFPAVRTGNDKVVQLLLQNGANVLMTEYRKTALFASDRSENDNYGGITAINLGCKNALFSAAEIGNNRIVQILLRNGIHADVVEHALFAAVRNKNDKVLEILLQNGVGAAVVNDVVNKKGETALFSFLETGNEKGAQILLNHGADVDAVNKKGETALFSFVKTGNEKGAQFLLNRGANVDAVNNDGDTPVIKAASTVGKGNYEVVQLLLKYGADVGAANKTGETALFSAVRIGKDEVVQLLLQHGADVKVVNKKGEAVLFSAIRTKNQELVRVLLQNGADVNFAQHKNGETALFYALGTLHNREDHTRFLELLLRYGADVNSRNINGKTPLCILLNPITQSMKDIRILIDSGADIAVRTAEGESVLHLLLTGTPSNDLSNERKAISLFARDANYSLAKSRDNQGNSTLHFWAALPTKCQDPSMNNERSTNVRSIGQELIDNGATVNAANDQNQTPLHMATSWEAAELLLKNKARPNPQDERGRTPLLSWAAVFSTAYSWKAILETGMNPWIADRNGTTVAGILLSNGKFDDVIDLVDAVRSSPVSDVNRVHTNGDTFLHIACQCESDQIQTLLDKLLHAGAKPNAKNADKETPLYIACKKVVLLHNLRSEDEALASVHFWAVNRLLKHGADTSVISKSGKSCIDLASGCRQLREMLNKSVDLLEIPALLPWSQQSDRHKKKLAQVTRGQRSEREGSYQYHTEPIGSGGFGHVYAGINTTDGREIALKCVERRHMCGPEDRREVRNLVKLKDYEQIVKYIEFFEMEQQRCVYIVLELMEGNLDECIDLGIADSSSLGILCKDVVTGLDFLHRNQILHRDIKPSNILYKTSPRLCLKIADFGLSSKQSLDTALTTTVIHTNAGTRCWMAPEILRALTRPEHSKETDVFACGLVLHYLFSGKKHPFAPAETSDKSSFVVQNDTERNIIDGNASVNGDLSPESKHLVELMIRDDAKERIVTEEALNHVFLWSKEKRMRFVCAVGNQPEFETPWNYPSSQVITELETTLGAQFVTAPWHNKIRSIYSEMTSSRRGRGYNTASAVQLVRFVRNCQVHVSERNRSTPMKKALLFNFIFFVEFPTLLMDVYRAVMNNKWDQNREEITKVMNEQ